MIRDPEGVSQAHPLGYLTRVRQTNKQAKGPEPDRGAGVVLDQ
jgi:hypothetical protein